MALLQELDTGTPIRLGAAEVALTIDGQTVRVPRGTSVMAAAALPNAPIPRPCATDSLSRRSAPAGLPRSDRGAQGHAGVLHAPRPKREWSYIRRRRGSPSCGVA